MNHSSIVRFPGRYVAIAAVIAHHTFGNKRYSSRTKCNSIIPKATRLSVLTCRSAISIYAMRSGRLLSTANSPIKNNGRWRPSSAPSSNASMTMASPSTCQGNWGKARIANSSIPLTNICRKLIIYRCDPWPRMLHRLIRVKTPPHMPYQPKCLICKFLRNRRRKRWPRRRKVKVTRLNNDLRFEASQICFLNAGMGVKLWRNSVFSAP